MNKIKRLNVNVVSIISFRIIFCCQIKSLLRISNLIKIDKVILSNWYQNLDDKLIKECVRFKINIL